MVFDFDANGELVGIDVRHASERADIHNLSISKLPFGVPFPLHRRSLLSI